MARWAEVRLHWLASGTKQQLALIPLRAVTPAPGVAVALTASGHTVPLRIFGVHRWGHRCRRGCLGSPPRRLPKQCTRAVGLEHT